MPKNDSTPSVLSLKKQAFKKILKNPWPRYDHPLYHKAYYGTENLLTQLFSEKKKNEFRTNVLTYGSTYMDFGKHVKKCIDEIDVAIETIECTLPKERVGAEPKKDHIPLPFISMSFAEEDEEINGYFIGLLEALSIKYLTGKQYSKESVPDKIKSRIDKSDILISILTRKHQIEGDKYTTSAWCMKEISYAQGKGKDVVIIAEKNITEIAGLNYEKDIIYLERENVKSIKKATIKFIEALKEHELLR